MTKKTAKDNGLPLVKFDVTQAALARIEADSKAMILPTNPKEYEVLTKQIALIRTTRTAVEKRRKAENAPVLVWQRALKAHADTLIEALKRSEDPLLVLKREYDDEKDRVRREKAEAEQKRLNDLSEKVNQIHRYRDGITLNHTSAQIGELIEFVDALVVDEDHFQELESSAFAAKAETLRFLNARLKDVEQKEKEDKQRRIDQIEIDRVQKEQKEQQDRLDEQQREIDDKRKQQEKEDRERKEKIEAEEREKQDKIDQAAKEKQDKIDAENLKKAEAADKRKKAAYRKKLDKDIPAAREYLEKLSAVNVPDLKTEECIVIVEIVHTYIAGADGDLDKLEKDDG